MANRYDTTRQCCFPRISARPFPLLALETSGADRRIVGCNASLTVSFATTRYLRLIAIASRQSRRSASDEKASFPIRNFPQDNSSSAIRESAREFTQWVTKRGGKGGGAGREGRRTQGASLLGIPGGKRKKRRDPWQHTLLCLICTHTHTHTHRHVHFLNKSKLVATLCCTCITVVAGEISTRGRSDRSRAYLAFPDFKEMERLGEKFAQNSSNPRRSEARSSVNLADE